MQNLARKIYSLFFFFLFPIYLFAKSPGLDDTISTVSKEIAALVPEELPQNTIIAILDFDSSSEKLGSYIQDKLHSDIMECKKYTIVTRQHLDVLEKESDFQYSGYVSDATALSICEKLGAAALVIGKIEEFGKNFRLTVKMIGVEKGDYCYFKNYTVSNDDTIKILTKDEVKEEPVKKSEKVSVQKEKNQKSKSSSKSQRYYDNGYSAAYSYDDDGNASKSLAVHVEGNGYTIDGVAPCAALSFTYERNEKISFGARLGFSYDVSSKDVTIFTLEPLLTGRFYPFYSRYSAVKNLFLEAQLGLALANVDGNFHTKTSRGDFNKYMLCGAGEIGWRHYFGNTDASNWYIEPYIRAGTPFLFGAGVAAGISF